MRGVVADGTTIRLARSRRGLTQEQLAGLADVDVKTVRKAERNGRLDAVVLSRLAFALGAEVGTFVRSAESRSADHEARRKAVERWLEAWDARDVEGVLATYHERAVMSLPGDPGIPYSGRFEGKEAIRRAHETAWATTKTVPVDGGDYTIHSSGDVLILDAVKGVLLPDGDVFRLRCVQLFLFDGGLIAEQRVEYDTLALARLVGPRD